MSSEMYVKKTFYAGLDTSVTAVAGTDIPNLTQVETLVAGATYNLEAARVEASSNIDITTASLAIIDGVQTAAGDRVLLTAQTDPIDNGVYVVVDGGTWTRAADAAAAATLKPGTKIYIEEGTDHASHEQKLQATGDVTVGTDAQVWVHAYTYDQNASGIDADNTGNTLLTGTTVQAQLDQVETNLVSQAADIQTNADAIANLDVSGQIETYYDGQKEIQTGVTIAPTAWTTITHSLNDLNLFIQIVDEGGVVVTDAFNIEQLTTSTFRIQNESSVTHSNMKVFMRS